MYSTERERLFCELQGSTITEKIEQSNQLIRKNISEARKDYYTHILTIIMSSYGAIDSNSKPSQAAQAAADAAASSLSNALPSAQSFQEADMLFLTSKEASKDERRRKFLSALVPILVAVLIIFVCGSIALRAIGPVRDPKLPPIASTSTAPAPQKEGTGKLPPIAPTSTAPALQKEDTGNMEASCSENRACNRLGLTGLCCPTASGVMLGCCH